ncbi:hypothetical protein [Rhodococcus sp. P14]|uniref:hypothetical protein n=1 Tax=Rhodococcus sp. P14 TaxID=450821 RepID=UPI00030A3671
MSADSEPSLDFVFPQCDIEYVDSEAPEQSRQVRVVDNSLRPSQQANVAAF